jgi:predicted RNA-binding protein with PIN domain
MADEGHIIPTIIQWLILSSTIRKVGVQCLRIQGHIVDKICKYASIISLKVICLFGRSASGGSGGARLLYIVAIMCCAMSLSVMKISLC